MTDKKYTELKNFFDRCFLEFKAFCDERHNIYVNQFYDKGITYSFHTDIVLLQGEKFLYLINIELDKFIVKCGLKGHDLIEDARLSYNDIKNVIIDIFNKNNSKEFFTDEEIKKIATDIAEIVFLV